MKSIHTSARPALPGLPGALLAGIPALLEITRGWPGRSTRFVRLMALLAGSALPTVAAPLPMAGQGYQNLPRIGIYGNKVEFETNILGRSVETKHLHYTPTTWSGIYNAPAALAGQLSNYGLTVNSTLLPIFQFYPNEGRLTDATLDQIIAGAYDTNFATLGQKFVDAGFTDVWIRPWHEYNGGWYNWGWNHTATGTSITPSKFKQAWDRAVTKIKAVSGTRVKFVLNVASRNTQPLTWTTVWDNIPSNIDAFALNFYTTGAWQEQFPTLQVQIDAWNNTWKPLWETAATLCRDRNIPLAFTEWGPIRIGTGQNDGWHNSPEFNRLSLEWMIETGVWFLCPFNHDGTGGSSRISNKNSPSDPSYPTFVVVKDHLGASPVYQPTWASAPEINVKGNGVSIADGDTTPSSSDHTDFGSTAVSGGTVTRTFTVENTGTASLSVNTVSLSGTHAADFAVTAQPAGSVAAAGNTTFQVRFDPSASGTRTASLSFGNGDANENPYNFSIQGTGSSGSTTVTFYSIGAEDRTILESTETSNVGGSMEPSGSTDIWVGDNALKKQGRSILSFDTSSLPDGATILSATLRMNRFAVTGTNPFTWGGECRVDIRNGGFNGNVALENADFEATASASNVAQMSSPAANGDWSSGALNSTGLAQISKTGKTQFRVDFQIDDNNNGTSDFMRFKSGDSAASKPELVIVYQ